MNSFDLLILTELEDFENNLDVALAADVQLVDDIARYMSKLKGKRLRPALALLSAKAVGLECKDDIIDAAVAVEMIHAGLGIGLLAKNSCQNALEQGQLVSVLDAWQIEPAKVYALYASREQLAPSIRAFILFMQQQFQHVSD